MKKFVLFCWDRYYPDGGLHDIKGSFDSLEEAMATRSLLSYDGVQIVDRDTWEPVYAHRDGLAWEWE